MAPEIRDYPERLTAARRQLIPLREIGHAIGLGASVLRDQLVDSGTRVLSAPYARYHSFTREETDIEVGFEVDGRVQIEGIEMSSLSAGREAVLVHQGSYKDIPKTFAILEQWVAENAEQRDAPREVYLSDPDEVVMADRVTEIVFPIV
ncbi:MAG: GyrI-like domain-containing protein [bacterium]|nr:GyrI-like domain-containing protein [bacterium]